MDDRLAAAVRAKQEAAGEGPSHEIQGVTFTFPALGDVAFTDLEKLETNTHQGLDALLNGQADKFWELRPSALEVTALREILVEEYVGMLTGESRASRGSSKKSSSRSRPPSRATTAKTS